MDYYEELGLGPSATPDEIRSAHRRLSMLLHPDRQTDPDLRRAAGLQMSRINSIIDTLVDPESRRAYDRMQAAALRPSRRAHLLFRVSAVAEQHPSMVGYGATVAAAIVLTVVSLWIFAGDWIHFTPPSGEPKAAVRVSAAPESAAKPPARPATAARRRPRARAAAPSEPASPLPMLEPPPAPFAAAREMLPPPLIAFQQPPKPVLDDPSPSRDTKVKDISDPERPSAAGLWIFSAVTYKPESSPVRLYEPEFIQLQVGVAGGHLRGRYRARYVVPDRAISSEMAFDFEGEPVPVRPFNWRAADGSRGVVELKLLSPEKMRVDWRVTDFGARASLGAGTAVLVRKLER